MSPPKQTRFWTRSALVLASVVVGLTAACSGSSEQPAPSPSAATGQQADRSRALL